MSRRPTHSAFADALGISDSAFSLLRDLIEQRLGVFYDDGKRDLLADKLSQVVSRHDMQSFLDYYYTLKYDEAADDFWTELANALAVPETYFWRQPDQIEALAQLLVPAHFEQHTRTLRIWSAACCSGEEPLSIAMALAETGAFARGRIEILASDASPAMVQRARRGLYGERSFRNLPLELRQRYFTEEDAGWRVSRDLHERVTWHVLNLLSRDQVLELPPVDIILCRNVFIYFSDAAIERVAHTLSEKIPHGGKLFLGAAESLTRLHTRFSLDEIGKAFVYVNQKDAAAAGPLDGLRAAGSA
jgi:chemotaxis protein methyltransferase CheR